MRQAATWLCWLIMLPIASFAFGGPSWAEAQRINIEWLEPRAVESQDSFLTRLLLSIHATGQAKVVRDETTGAYSVELHGVGITGGAEW